ncbi:sugar ABC transporter substrate-binding protein [Kribbella alba]|uniref:Sugar ABC transporter substrate-binding protein n=1 Tax=Kribbella alba TaxID=190197 RepID=A0ABN2F3N7_9ACTN
MTSLRTKRMIALILSVVAAAGLSACSVGQASGGGSSKNIDFWTINLKEGYTPYITTLMKNYETAHPGVTINWVDIPDLTQAQTRLTAALSSGKSPDVVNVTPFILPQLAKSGAVLPLSKITGDTAAIGSKYTKGFWDAGVLNGEAYAIPYYGSASALLYNKAIFQKAGLNPAKPPQTWAEVFADSKIIYAKTGIPGFVQTLDDFDDAGNPADIIASQAGVPLLNADGTKSVFNTPTAVSYFQNYVDGVKAGWISKTSVNGVVLDGAGELAKGKVAMTFLGPWSLRWTKANSSADVYKNIVLAPHIKSPTGYSNAFLQQFAIPSGSKNPAQALDFARYVSGTVVTLASQAPVLPTLTADVTSPKYLSLFGAKVLTAEPIKFFWPQDPNVAQLIASLRENMQAALLGSKSTQQALDDAVQTWDSLLTK